MLWRGGRQSTNVEDRRGLRLGPGLVGGGLGTIVLVLLAMFLGVDPGAVIDSGGYDQAVDTGPIENSPADQETKKFVSTVLGFTEDAWSDIFASTGREYREPKLVLYTRAVESACGFGQSAMGPFYCPADEKVYLDTSFFQDLHNRFKAPGDFAQAYVIAHEVGHHVQNLLDISRQVEAIQQRGSEGQVNQASVRLELQADCFAGVWANHTERTQQQSQIGGFLERGDVEEALQAAASVGDDRLQMQSRGYVVPESFTHGSAEQRARWFNQGLRQGSVSACNTFEVANP
jgi:predicted metalloprotease